MVMVLAGNGSITGVTSMPTAMSLGTITANNGITFPATQVSSADANTLDDYEEGFFQAYMSNSSGTPLYTGSNLYAQRSTGPNGKYTKIGRRVFFNFYIYHLDSFNYNTGITSSTLTFIAGLPFVESGSGTQFGTYPACVCGWQNAAEWSAAYTPMGIIETGQSIMRVSFQNANVMTQAPAKHWFTAGSTMIWSGHYETTT